MSELNQQTATSPPIQQAAPPSPPAAEKEQSLARVAAASLIGTTIEYYDFFIYGTAAALVFPTIFFPDVDPAIGAISSFATFAVAFFARPVGAVLLGHFGDKLGRKRTLVWTLIVMGLSTIAIGFMPGHSVGVFGLFEGGIGMWAPVILVIMRFLQGFAVGGEWAGATLLTAEYAPEGKRGKMAIYPQLGPAIGFLLASGTFFVASVTAGSTSTAFLNYGWRIPFIASAVLVIFGLWVRLAVDETPVFKEQQRKQAENTAPQKLPFAEVVRGHWKEILIASGAMATLFSLFYTGTAFLTNYGTGHLDFSRTTILGMGMIAAVIFGLGTIASAILSDRIGRRKIILTVVAVAVPWTLLLFPIVDTGSPLALGIGITGTLVLYGAAYGPTGALLPEMFPARFRYTGAGLVYNLAGILGGALPPLFAAQIVMNYSSIWVGAMLAVLAALSVVCVIFMSETKDRDIENGLETED